MRQAETGRDGQSQTRQGSTECRELLSTVFVVERLHGAELHHSLLPYTSAHVHAHTCVPTRRHGRVSKNVHTHVCLLDGLDIGRI